MVQQIMVQRGLGRVPIGGCPKNAPAVRVDFRYLKPEGSKFLPWNHVGSPKGVGAVHEIEAERCARCHMHYRCNNVSAYSGKSKRYQSDPERFHPNGRIVGNKQHPCFIVVFSCRHQ
jgi:hypothetical protein